MYSQYFKYKDWQYENIHVKGISVAGIGTCLCLPELSLTIDVAQGLPFAFKSKNFLITHSHMDHASGIPYIISQKALNKVSPPVFYMPKEMLLGMTNIMKEWERIDGHQYQYDFKDAEVGKVYSLDKIHSFTPFKTFHRVPSVGYTVFENRKKLKKDYENLSQSEILNLKNSGKNITESIALPIFSYTGDTTMAFWNDNPEALKSKVLFMEITYWDKKKSISHAQEWGHIHLDEVIDRLDEFKGEKIVFTHISSRYSLEYAKEILKQKVPKKYQDLVEVFP